VVLSATLYLCRALNRFVCSLSLNVGAAVIAAAKSSYLSVFNSISRISCTNALLYFCVSF
jgi:hypothetical protein